MLISLLSLELKEVSQKMKGRRSLSRGHFLPLKSDGFSVLKRVSKDMVACRFSGDSLLCSARKFLFEVISFYCIPSGPKNQVFHQKDDIVCGKIKLAPCLTYSGRGV
ncbi:MAG: hypothetical protein DRZ76_02860 [Candidatus Nealsonbacteria bacterium]|nr:MAG: hypothetical protein DRZ76_02860 [Candidatus Nealsonbacteria bacterium]